VYCPLMNDAQTSDAHFSREVFLVETARRYWEARRQEQLLGDSLEDLGVNFDDRKAANRLIEALATNSDEKAVEVARRFLSVLDEATSTSQGPNVDSVFQQIYTVVQEERTTFVQDIASKLGLAIPTVRRNLLAMSTHVYLKGNEVQDLGDGSSRPRWTQGGR